MRTTIIIFYPTSLFLSFVSYIRHVTCACDSLSFYYVRYSLFCVFLVVCCVVLYTVSTLLTAHIRSVQKYPVMRGNRIRERCSKFVVKRLHRVLDNSFVRYLARDSFFFFFFFFFFFCVLRNPNLHTSCPDPRPGTEVPSRR